jgi:hypothetical protein
LCSGQTVIIGGILRDTAGIYHEALKTTKGCDSIVITNLVINPAAFSARAVTICSYESILINNKPVSAPGVYLDSFKTTLGCDSVVQITLAVSSLNNAVVQINNALKSLQDSATYRWLDCNNTFAALPGQTSQIYTATADGNYAVEVKRHNCTDTSACYAVTGTSGIDKNNSAGNIKVYPNPANDIITISAQGIKTITITDMQGKNIQCAVLAQHDDSRVLDISGIANGLYVVKVATGQGTVLQKLVVQR